MTDTHTHKTTASHACPRCHTPTTWTDNPYRPFCGERCKLIDLGAWASEDYKIASEDTPFSEELGKPS
ncbi:MAG: DNA gyrase inhibitor YacG [Moraxella sp.]|nr:DNA gyrase inhibitor YacG [Moraxella sp.]